VVDKVEVIPPEIVNNKKIKVQQSYLWLPGHIRIDIKI